MNYHLICKLSILIIIAEGQVDVEDVVCAEVQGGNEEVRWVKENHRSNNFQLEPVKLRFIF